ncbi:peptide chain release factor 2 [Candidatus Magnetominusculus xianensis]|uniref:peptide chain release factor 2 n=1 Tax=Candidatus Magnetominusculus xianensis TaxID=1748249 RepID=UPI001F011EBF|nr:peptide chain release factor 2 [Candidatus Magnetominusculus xianensis]
MIIEMELKVKPLEGKLSYLRGYLEIDNLLNEIKAIDETLSQSGTWSSYERLNELQKKKSYIEDVIASYNDVENDVRYLFDSLSVLGEEDGELFVKDIEEKLKSTEIKIDKLELKHLLSHKLDINNAIVDIHPGAGGTESQDWAQMLMRMYLRWAEKNGFKADIIDILNGDEAGIKSVTIAFSGPYAYGYLKPEVGVHRLVRISPFDSNKRRHTSFAAVLVYPDVEKDIEIDIKEEDIRIDTFRASGAGGQHINKVSSAVRITHAPSGIVVSCQNERSQHRNKERAMSILKSRLYEMEIAAQGKKMEGIIGDKKNIQWGNQIRSYVLQPYRLVKDHRTGYESGNVNAVLNGEIDAFIKEYLFWKKTG